MLMLNTYNSALYGHYYFHEHTELSQLTHANHPVVRVIFSQKGKHNTEKPYAHV
jgi:hypothetical protein